MDDMMTFPNTWEEFEQVYGITDREEIYTNGARLIPSFRVKQWLDHIAEPEKHTEERTEMHSCDLISRQAVQEMVDRIGGMYPYRQIGNRESYSQYNEAWTDAISRVDAELNSLPSVESEQQYTEEEIKVFRSGISLRLLSLRSAQKWKYEEETATEIKFLERLYEKVGEDMRGE